MENTEGAGSLSPAEEEEEAEEEEAEEEEAAAEKEEEEEEEEEEATCNFPGRLVALASCIFINFLILENGMG